MRKEQKAHLLIVDPDQKHRNDWTLELSKAGFLVSSALNLDDAKTLLDAHVFDAIAYSQEFESPSFAAAKQSLESDWPQLVIFGSRDTPEDIKGQLATSMEDDKKPIEAEIPANDRADTGLYALDPDLLNLPLTKAKQVFEKIYLESLMKETHGNISKTSKRAGRYRADIYRLLQRYELHIEQYR